jgi:hypothetical protein
MLLLVDLHALTEFEFFFERQGCGSAQTFEENGSSRRA